MGRKAEIRLYVDARLGQGQAVKLSGDVAHYLFSVMRRSVGEVVRLFNGVDGEWEARITAGNRKGGEAVCEVQVRQQEPLADLWLAFAPIRRARLEVLVEKASEIGAARLMPVITQFTDKTALRGDRLTSIAREAAEQSRALGLPVLDAACPLAALLEDWPPDRPLIFADEAAPVVRPRWPVGRAGILIGPEGGFCEAERKMIRSHGACHPVSLGPRTLRAETAALVALARWHEAQM